MEEWRPVVGYEGLYEVSSHGEVRSVDRVIQGPHGPARLRGKIRRQGLGRGGYKHVGVSKDGVARTIKVHTLVLEAFHGPRPFEDALCRHLDGDCQNNHVSNLQWGTAKENLEDSIRHGTHYRTFKEKVCPMGHPIQGPNRLDRGEKLYQCRACARLDQWVRRHPGCDKEREAALFYEEVMSGQTRNQGGRNAPL